MTGATGSGQEMQTGRTNRAEGRTTLWAQVPPGQENFNGPAILIVDVAQSALDPDDYEDLSSPFPSNAFHGIIGIGNSRTRGNTNGPEIAFGVLGRGGLDQGTGVIGRGGGVPEPQVNGAGGIGVQGLGGSQTNLFPDPTTPPGAGVIGQGGRQTDEGNRARLPHAAGLIGIGGGTGLNNFDLLPKHSLTETGGVGVYAQGADATVTMVVPRDADGEIISGPNVPSGPLAPGAGVIGRGGVPIPLDGSIAAGVIGLAGDTAIPPIFETGDTGVYGRGPIGVQGRGETSRGGVFSTKNQPQVRLIPLEIETPAQLPGTAQPGDLLVTIEVDERGTKVASLWFCKVGGTFIQTSWAKLA